MRATSLLRGCRFFRAGLALALVAAAHLGCGGDVTSEQGGQGVAPTDPNAGTETNVFPVPCSRDADCGEAGKCIPGDASTDAGQCEVTEP